MRMNSGQRVLILGVTSTIAHATARLLVQRGCHIFGVGRNQAKLTAVLADLRVRAGPDQRVGGCQADLDDIQDHAAHFDAAETALGGIDIILMAQGVLPDQSLCASDASSMMAAMVTNALGPIALLVEARRRLLERGEGAIVAIGSVAGDRGRQSNYVYGAAKGMLDLYLQGLRNELAGRGVHVMTVKPGFVDTAMTASIASKGPLWSTPERVAAGIVRGLDRRRDVVYLPWFWRWIMFVIRIVPERIFKRLSL